HAIIQSRAKTVASYAGKILRKKYKDPLSEVTDLYGARVIVQLPSEVQAVCQAVRQHFVIDEQNSLDALSRLRVAEFGYRSVHYVVRLPHDDVRGLRLPLAAQSLRGEIQ